MAHPYAPDVQIIKIRSIVAHEVNWRIINAGYTHFTFPTLIINKR